jgi:hypothetical protein
MSVVFFLPAFASIWVSGLLSLLLVGIDTVFSYLYVERFNKQLDLGCEQSC